MTMLILRTMLTQCKVIWVFDWLIGMRGALPKELFSEKQYPKVYAWVARFNQAIKAARSAAPKPMILKGPEATQRIENAHFAEVELSVAADDPLGLKAGDTVEVWPIDSGFGHKDTGALLGLTEDEVVLGVKSQNGQDIRIHHPRQQFRIRAVSPGSGSKL